MCSICDANTALENKTIDRNDQGSEIFRRRTLEQDYRTLLQVIKPGMRVLDIGCATGSISKGIADILGPDGVVIGIDHTERFIEEGKHLYADTHNLQLISTDLLAFQDDEKFDLIVSARTFQWISTLDSAIEKVKSLLRPNGRVSILDYNHEAITWTPSVPGSMRNFYDMFLMWRRDGGMNNRIAFDLPDILEEHGFTQVESLNADEHYHSDDPSHAEPLKIWSYAARSTQMVKEGYISEAERLAAINDYNDWIDRGMCSMTMRLREVRAILN